MDLIPEQDAFLVHLPERSPLVVEEAGLLGLDDDHVEQVPPVLAHDVAHALVHEAAGAVGDEKHLLAVVGQLGQHRPRLLGVADVLLDVRFDGSVHYALDVDVPDGVLDVLVQVHGLVVDVVLEEVLVHARQQRHLGQREDVHELLHGVAVGALSVEVAHLLQGHVGALVHLDDLLVGHHGQASVHRAQLDVVESVDLHQHGPLHVVVEAADGEAGVVLVPPDLRGVPVLVDEEVAGRVEDERVQVLGVEDQRVVVVEAVDLDVRQAHLVVGEDGVGVQRAAHDGGDQLLRAPLGLPVAVPQAAPPARPPPPPPPRRPAPAPQPHSRREGAARAPEVITTFFNNSEVCKGDKKKQNAETNQCASNYDGC